MFNVSDDGVGSLKGIDIRNTKSLGLQVSNDLVLKLQRTIEIKGKKVQKA